MKTVKGDLIEMAQNGEFDVIAHGCNCFCKMGAGIAKSIKQHFWDAYEADLKTKIGDMEKLGTCTSAQIGDLVVVNAYTQYDHKGRGVKVDYDAVQNCMRLIAENYPDARIGLPKIGSGLAGGDWDRIQQIIEEEMDGLDVTIVEYAP